MLCLLTRAASFVVVAYVVFQFSAFVLALCVLVCCVVLLFWLFCVLLLVSC